jgi:hypothetical protein
MLVKNKKKVNYPRMLTGIRVTERDYQRLKREAEATGLKFTDHIRQLLTTGKAVSSDRLAEVRREINKIGVNINQIAHRANEHGYDDSIYIDALGILDELKRKLTEI